MVLRISLKLILNIVNKGLRIPNILFKQDFEFRLYDKSSAFVVAFVLSLFEADSTIKK